MSGASAEAGRTPDGGSGNRGRGRAGPTRGWWGTCRSARRSAPPFHRGPDQEARVRHDLLDRGHIHLARAQASGALVVANLAAMRLRALAEIDRFRVFLRHVADDLAVLAEEHVAVGIEHDALGLERARRGAVVPVRD